MPERKRFYPAKRKKSNRTKESYRANSPEAEARKLANLAKGRKAKRYKPNFLGDSRAKLTEADLQKLNIVEFAEWVLKVNFDSRPNQRLILKSIYGLQLTPDERKQYLELTSDEMMPDGRVFQEDVEKREVCLALGARAGKSMISSILACYEATRNHWHQFLLPDEKGYCQLYATREVQSIAIIGQGCLRLLENSKISHLIEDDISNSIILKNNIVIQSFPANSTSGRGLPTVCLILDEVAHFSNVGPKADSLIADAIRPRLSQFEKSKPKVILISTPSAKSGLFWDTYNEGPRIDGRLTMRGSTRQINPCIEQSFIDRERERDIENCRREFDSEFCETVDAFFDSESLDKCFVLTGDNPPDFRYKYFLAIDQTGAGATSKDRFGLTICHRESDVIITDCLREWATKNLDAIFLEIGILAKSYNLTSCVIDRYAHGYVSNKLEKLGLTTEFRPQLPVVYCNGKRLVLSGLLKLPVNKSLRIGLLRTQSYFGRNQSLSIAHERSAEHGHADVADSTMSAAWAASNKNEGGYFAKALAAMDKRLLQEKENGQSI